MLRNRNVYSKEHLSLTILPTGDCNFRCIYCYEEPSNTYMSDETERRILLFLEKNLKRYRSLRISWFGGEPLVNKNRVIEMAIAINRLCKENKVLLASDMTTNGYELDLRTFRTLIRNKVMSYQICIDGKKETHNYNRPHVYDDDSYSRILDNIRNIKENVRSATFEVVLRTNITPFVEEGMREYLNDIGNIIKSDPRFRLYIQGVREWGGERIKKNLIVQKDEAAYYDKWYDIIATMGLYSADKFSFDPAVHMCVGCIDNGYIIDYDGSLHKCSLALYNEEYNDQDYIGYKDIENLDWNSSFDTMILSHTRMLSTILKKNIIDITVDKCITHNKNLFCFDPIYDADILAKLESSGTSTYFPQITEQDVPFNRQGKLRVIGKPILAIMGTSSRQGKFSLQLHMRKMMSEMGVKVCNLGTEPSSDLFGFDAVYPMGYESAVETMGWQSVAVINEIIGELERLDPDIIIIGSQSNTIPYDRASIYSYPIKQHELLLGSSPDAYILCVNGDDDVDFIQRTIRYLESLFDTKVICLCMFPYSKGHDWSKKGSDVQRLDNNKTLFEHTLELTVYDITNTDSVQMLVKECLAYFTN